MKRTDIEHIMSKLIAKQRAKDSK